VTAHELDETTLWLASTADDAAAAGKPALAGIAGRALAELRRLRKIEQAAIAWTEARKFDARLMDRSVIPTAQALLDALESKP
jgi:hypothetical protein